MCPRKTVHDDVQQVPSLISLGKRQAFAEISSSFIFLLRNLLLTYFNSSNFLAQNCSRPRFRAPGGAGTYSEVEDDELEVE